MGRARPPAEPAQPHRHQRADRRIALSVRRGDRKQRDRGPHQSIAEEARAHIDRDRARRGIPIERYMRTQRETRPWSLSRRLLFSLTVSLGTLWLMAAGLAGWGTVHETNEVFDSALE